MKPKLFENLETAVNGTEISPKSFQKLWKLLNFQNANRSTESSSFSGSKVEWKENLREHFFENLGITCKVVLFLEIWKNAVAFAHGSCRKFKPDVSVEWKALVGTKMKNPSLVPTRFRLGHSWTLPWAVTSPDQERTPRDWAGKTQNPLFVRALLQLRRLFARPPDETTSYAGTQLAVYCTFFSTSPVIHNASLEQ